MPRGGTTGSCRRFKRALPSSAMIGGLPPTTLRNRRRFAVFRRPARCLSQPFPAMRRRAAVRLPRAVFRAMMAPSLPTFDHVASASCGAGRGPARNDAGLTCRFEVELFDYSALHGDAGTAMRTTFRSHRVHARGSFSNFVNDDQPAGAAGILFCAPAFIYELANLLLMMIVLFPGIPKRFSRPVASARVTLTWHFHTSTKFLRSLQLV